MGHSSRFATRHILTWLDWHCRLNRKYAATLRHTLLSAVLAYLVGIAAIILTSVCIDVIYVEPNYSDDIWRNKIMRIHAVFGIVGAVVGALVSLRLARSTYTQNRTEPRDATESSS